MAAQRKKKSTSSPRRKPGKTQAPDAVTLLKSDHRKVEDLFAKLEKTTERGAGRRVALVGQIGAELEKHMALEEDVFYPAFREAVRKKDDKELYHEAREEHHAARLILSELAELDPTDETFGAKAKVLKEMIEHHVEEEEEEMFPKAKRAMGMAGLRELGQEMAARKG